MAALCACGCGLPAPIARQTIRRLGYVKGEPVRFVRGHNGRKPRPLCACGCGNRVVECRARWVKGHDKFKARLEPNPSGVCLCGCGKRTPIATKSRADRGDIVGKPVRYIRGHYGRIAEPVKDPATGCWNWQGAKGTHGRGSKGVDGQQVLAYRAYYEQHVGPIPEGYQLHHRCENPMCVNPAHLEAVTPAEHGRRHAAKI